MSDGRAGNVVLWLERVPSHLRTVIGGVVGYALGRGAWAGGWWGLLVLGVMFTLCFLVLWIAVEFAE